MYKLSGIEIHNLLLKGALSAEEITRSFLKRIEDHDPKIGAFLSVFSEKSLAKAKSIDERRSRGEKLGKLAGIPIAIKDNIHMNGEYTTCASRFLSSYRAVFDASVCKFLQDEDAILIGKTNLDEFAMGSSTENSAFKVTKNPWNLQCTAGGSSGGASAAVAARLCPISLGSDTGGSIRQPASFTSTVGFKPTYGRVSRHGLVAFASSLDQIGPLSHTVADAALCMEILSKHCEMDSTSINAPQEEFVSKLQKPIQGCKIGVCWSSIEDLTPEVKENFLKSLEVYKQLGCTIVDVDLDIFKYSIAIYYILATAEASTNLARFDGVRYGNRSPKAVTVEEMVDFSRSEGFGPEVKRRILLGTYVLSSGYQDAYYKKAQKVRSLFIEKLKEAFAICDIIASPTCPFPAFAVGSIHDPLQMYLQDLYTIPANLAGIPSVSVPSGFSKSGMPLGLQLSGPQMHDSSVLRFAYHFEQAVQIYNKIPDLFDEVK